MSSKKNDRRQMIIRIMCMGMAFLMVFSAIATILALL